MLGLNETNEFIHTKECENNQSVEGSTLENI